MKTTKKDKFYPQDESYIRKTTIVEEFLNIDESLKELEKNNDLIRMEMNIIEFPIFSRSKSLKPNQIKKYYFSSDKKSYLEVTPGNKETIPGELEERVFIALLKIFKNKGYQQNFYCSLSEIISNLNISKNSYNAMYERIRKALNRLASTNFKFKNLFYSSELNKQVDDLINTSILSYRAITFKDASDVELNYFSDKRTKEIYVIMLSQHFYENIVRKGYLVFDADDLLNIKDSVTRSIFSMISKWRNNGLYLKKQAFFIARRIPLSWSATTTRKTVLKINSSLEELKKLGYISNFNLIKGKKIDNTEFEIFFDKEHNKLKQNHFYDERANYDTIIHLVEDRINEHCPVEINVFLDNIVTIFGTKGTSLKTLPNVIKEALKQYDYEYVLYSAEYTMINAKVSILKYFKDTLSNNWADEYIAKKKLKKEKIREKEVEEAVIIEETKEEFKPIFSWEDFEKLSDEAQNQLTSIAYENYLSETESRDNKTNRGIFEKAKKSLILKLSDKYLELKKDDKKDSQCVFATFDDYNSINYTINSIKNSFVEEFSPSHVKIMEETINFKSGIKYKKYSSMAKFVVEVYLIVKKKNTEITMEDFGSVLKIFEEYEDNYVHAIYNTSENIGGYMLK